MLGNKGTGREYRDGGCRGGQDQFKWEDVKADAYRESYLGHSLHAPVGRWQKGKDLLWYTKKNAGADGVNHAARLREQAADERRAEIAALKLMEEDMLNQELGLAVKKRRVGGQALEQSEIDALLARGETSRSQTDVERISGLGAAASRRVDQTSQPSFAEKELARRQQVEMERMLRMGSGHEEVGASGGGRNSPRGREPDSKREKKKMKKERKRQKKERKKREKKERKERREHRKRSRSSSSESARSSRSG